MASDPAAHIRDTIAGHEWSPTTAFPARLEHLRRLLQDEVNGLPARPSFSPRVPIVFDLALDDLALVLPPSECRLLAHLRTRRPLRALIGTPGFHGVSRLNQRLQRLLS